MVTIVENSGDAPGAPGVPTLTPYAMTADDLFTGSLTDRDSDYVRIDLTPGYGYYATLSDEAGQSLHADANFWFADQSGDIVHYGAGYRAVPLADDTPLYGYVYGYYPQTETDTLAYTLSLLQEIGQGVGTATTLDLGETLNSAIDYSGDYDWIRVDLTAGYGYVFELGFEPTGEQWRFGLRDAEGDSLAGTYVTDGYYGLSYTPTEDETVFVQVAYRFSGPTGAYSLRYWQEEPGYVDVGGGPAQPFFAGARLATETLTLDQDVTASVDWTADVDGFRIDTVENATYRVALRYPDVPEGINFFRAYVFDADGTQVYGTRAAERSQHPTDVAFRFTSPSDGPLYLSVQAQDPDLVGQGYTITLELAEREGTSYDDLLNGSVLGDTLLGGQGADTLIGGNGNDLLQGGDSPIDLRDVIYGGAGDDTLDGGYGNDQLRGDDGDDQITGGVGVDEIFGGGGQDVLTGQAWSDLIFGGAGDDFINGGFGFDRVNGGDGGDHFFHLGVADHGSDWIQDYDAAAGDVLVFGGAATRDQFQVNFTETATAGAAGIEEAFVIHRPTGQILWALVDGGAQTQITLVIAGTEYDLLA